jgi:hypothetical protein
MVPVTVQGPIHIAAHGGSGNVGPLYVIAGYQWG